MMVDKEISFEEAFNRLEEVLQALESGGHTLEESMVLYEEGMRLAKRCHERLDSAELRITQIASLFQENDTIEESD